MSKEVQKCKKLSEETKKKISESNKGRIFSEESKKRISNGRMKPIIQYDLNGNFVKELASALDAEKHGFNRHNICKCLKGLRNKSGGFIWKYKAPTEENP